MRATLPAVLCLAFLSACPNGEPVGPSPCDGVSCSDHGHCVPDGTTAICLCEPGFESTGADCVTQTPCDPNPCREEGRSICLPAGLGVAICKCDEGLRDDGTACTAAVSCDPNPCTALNRGVCTLVGGRAVCGCNPGLVDDGKGGCIAPNPCSPNPCVEANRAQCSASGKAAICRCDPGFQDTGTVCAKASSCTPNPCTAPNRGVCTQVGGSVLCGCNAGFKDDGNGGCVAEDPCSPNPCQATHRGVCTVSGTAAICSCDPGFKDDGKGGCVTADSCTPSPCTAPHRGVCTVVGQVVVCGCDVGYKDDGAGHCVPADPCSPNPCTGNKRSVCLAVGATAVCSCDAGFKDDGSGACVPASTCSPNPCTAANRTVCAMSGTTATCSCDAGYRDNGAGQCVPLDPCTPNPCTGAHRSVCQASGAVAVCRCDAGYRDDGTGQCVSADPCDPNPCTASHQGVCTASGITAVCSCDPGYVPSASGCVVETGPTCSGSHTTGDAFEADECPALAKLATLPAAQARTVEPANDQDWISFDAVAGHVYFVEARTAGFVPALLVYQPNGTDVLVQHLPSSGTAAAVKTRFPAGRFLVKVRASSTTATGAYTLTLRDDGVDDHANSASDATALTVGTAASASLQYTGDQDWFAFTATPGHVYRVSATNTGSYSQYLEIWDGATKLRGNYGTNGLSYTLKLDKAGPFHVATYAYTSTALFVGTVKVEDLGADDHANSATGATALTAGTPATAQFQYEGDQDWFAFTATPGRIYRISATNTGGSSQWLEIWDGGTALRSNYGSGGLSYTLKLDKAGPFHVSTRPYYSTSFFAGTVKVEDLGVDDHANSATGATALTAGTAATAQFQYEGDQDWFAFTATPGHLYRVSATNTGSSSQWLEIRNAAGTTLRSDYGTGGLAYTLKLDEAGPFTLMTRPYYSTSFYTGTVKVEDLGLDDHANTAAGATVLAAGTPATAQFQYEGDQDWFVFTATPGHIYRVSATNTGSSSQWLEIWDGSTRLQSDYATGGTGYTLLFDKAGPFHVSTRPYYSTSLYTATVKVEDLGVDDHTNVAAGATALTVGTAATAQFQYQGDSDWFSFTAIPGHIYRMSATNSGSLSQWLDLWDGTTRLQSDYGSGGRTYTLLLDKAGPFHLSTRPYNSGSIFSSTVKVEDLGADDHGQDTTGATALDLGGAATSGAIQFPGDRDYFRFTVPTGANFAFQVITTGIATSVAVLNSGGGTVATTTGPGTYAFSVPGPGDYFVRVQASSGSATGSYGVRVSN